MTNNSKQKIIIISLSVMILLMAAGYAAFSSVLNIKGTSKISSNWDIRITNVTEGNKIGKAESLKEPTFDASSATFSAGLQSPGDSIEYNITVSNHGTLDSLLKTINLSKSTNPAIKFSVSGIREGQTIPKGTDKIFTVKIEFDKNADANTEDKIADLTIDLDYEQASGNEEVIPDNYEVIYDYQTNGGTESEIANQEYPIGSEIDLSPKAIKDGYEFVGWNTDKDAQTGLKTLTMEKQNITLYAIYKKTLNATYTKVDGVSEIGKTTDNCNIYNNEITCEITLPSITANEGYNIDGWYEVNTKVGNQGVKININKNINLIAKAIDNIAPTTPAIKSSYNLWGSKKYDANVNITSTNGYKEDVGIDGTWEIVASDPLIQFNNISNFKNISGVYIELGNSLNKDLKVQIFYTTTDKHSEANSTWKTLKAGETKLQIDIPKGDYKKIRYDIGNAESVGLSYKINELGLIADAGQWNNNSIRAIISSTDQGSGIDRYEWYKDSVWTTNEITTANKITAKNFTNSQNSNYKFRAIDKAGNISEEINVPIKIDTTKPIIDNVSTNSSTNSITVVTSAHDDESEVIKYEYSLDGTNWIEDTNTHTFTALPENNGYIIKVKVTNTVGLSETYTYESTLVNDLKNNTATTGDGLYKDAYESGRYIYRGENPNNYITFNNDTWRIIAIEADGTLKIMKDSSIGSMPYDERTNETTGPRLNSNNSYCSIFPTGYYYGCNAWNAVSGTYINGNKNGTVTENASLNDYLNSEYYKTISTNNQKYIKSHNFNVGGVVAPSSTSVGTFTEVQDAEKSIIWNGKVALPNLSDFLKATTSSECGTFYDARNGLCHTNNYLYKITPYWFINAWGNSVADVWQLTSTGSPGGTGIDGTSALLQYASTSVNVHPVLYIDSNISGTGTKENPYINGIQTEKLEVPTFKEVTTDNGKNITVTFPENCGKGLTCSYQKDNGAWETVNSSTQIITFKDSGTLIAKVTDGTTTKTSSYIVQISAKLGGLDVKIASSGDGLYVDTYEPGRYVYKGENPNNYITFNNEQWRIISVENDNTIKIIKQDLQGTSAFDVQGNRDSTGNNPGETYCETSTYGCNAWAKAEKYQSGGTVLKDASLNTYLNNDYYNSLNEKSKSIVDIHDFNIGKVSNAINAGEYIKKDKEAVWQGKIGLMSISDWFKSSNNHECTSESIDWCPSGNYNRDDYKCSWNNFLYKGAQEWTINPTNATSRYVLLIGTNGCIGSGSAAVAAVNYRPTLYLKNNLKFSGSGTESNPYIIN